MSDTKRDVLAGAVDGWNAAANRGFYQSLWAAFPGARLTVDDTIVEGDKLALRFHLSGEHRGEFLGIPRTGRPFVLNGQTIVRFRDERVVERWTTGDLLGVLVQPGVTPPPGG